MRYWFKGNLVNRPFICIGIVVTWLGVGEPEAFYSPVIRSQFFFFFFEPVPWVVNFKNTFQFPFYYQWNTCLW